MDKKSLDTQAVGVRGVGELFGQWSFVAYLHPRVMVLSWRVNLLGWFGMRESFFMSDLKVRVGVERDVMMYGVGYVELFS